MSRTIPLAVLAVSILAAIPLADDAFAQSIGTLADIVKTAETKSTTFGQLPPVSPGTSTIEMTFKRVVNGVDNNTFLIDGMPTTDADCRDEVWTFTIAKAIRPDATPTISIRSGQSFTSGGQSGCQFPPGTSSGLIPTSGTPNTTAISLSWTAPADPGSDPITDYIVQYKKSSETSWLNHTRTTTPRTMTSETVTGLDANTGYDFRVAAINRVDTSPFSSEATRSTHPSAPTGLSTSASASPYFNYTSIDLGWTAPSGGDQTITGYALHYKNSTSAWTLFNDGSSALTGENVTGLKENTAYQFRVAAVNNAGAGANSTATGTTEAAVRPDPPTNLLADSNNSTSILVTWDKPANNGGAEVTKYFIQYKLNGTSSWPSIANMSSTTTSKIVTGLTEGTWYNFRVAAMNSVGNSTTYHAGAPGMTIGQGICTDNQFSAYPKACYPAGTEKPSRLPGVPTEFDYVITATNVGFHRQVHANLIWKAPPTGDSGITQYFAAALDNNGNWDLRDCWLRNSNTLCFKNNLGDGLNYIWTVRAKNTAWGDERSFPMYMNMTGTKFTPSQVTGLSASPINATALALDWKKSLGRGAAITDYNIYHRIGESGAWIPYDDGTSTNTNATVNLTYGTQYEIRVAAVNSVGPGFGNNSTNTITYTTGLR